MLTPRFEITQTDTQITIIIHSPYSNIKDTDVDVNGTNFTFSSNPYYLRLVLPGEIADTNDASCSYDIDKGDFTYTFPKVNKGEHFENLDMITTLLAPPTRKSKSFPTIEVIGNPSASSADIDEDVNDNDATNDNSGDEWFISQNVEGQKTPKNITLLTNSPKYGFANKLSGALAAFEPAWLKEMIDLPTPDTTPETERKKLQEKRELENFNEDHYMADLMEPECIESYMTYFAEWEILQKNEVTFNEEELDLLKDLPNKEYLLDDEETRKLYLNLVDILFASCYNHRTTLGENTVESCWTINKLSSTLSWFQNFDSMNEVITACFRRSICYPYLRNWELSTKIFEDVKQVLKLGKKYVIKRFCEIHSLFNNSYEPRYLLNQLYITDFIIWLQTSPESRLEELQPILDDIHPDKESMGVYLVELETAAYSVKEEEEGLVIENTVHKVVGQLNELSVAESENQTSSSSSSSTDSETSDSESSTTSSSTNSVLDSDDLSEPE